MNDLPKPLVPPGIDLRDTPIPREAFARMAVVQFGVGYDEALADIDRMADRLKGGVSRQVRRSRRRARGTTTGTA